MRTWKAKVLNIGASKGVVIPKLYCKDMRIERGDYVMVSVEKDGNSN